MRCSSKSITSDPSRCRTSIPHPEQYRQLCIIQGLTLILCRRSIFPVTRRKRRCKEHFCSCLLYTSHNHSGHYTGTYGVSSRFKLRPSVCCPAFYEYRRKHPYNLRCTAFRNTSGSFYSIFSYYLGNDKGIFPYYKGYFHR